MTKPVNFMTRFGGRSFSVAGLAAAGVKRSKEHGTCRFLDTALATPDLNRLFADGSSSSRG